MKDESWKESMRDVLRELGFTHGSSLISGYEKWHYDNELFVTIYSDEAHCEIRGRVETVYDAAALRNILLEVTGVTPKKEKPVVETISSRKVFTNVVKFEIERVDSQIKDLCVKCSILEDERRNLKNLFAIICRSKFQSALSSVLERYDNKETK